jgi:hypothetical protein
MLSEAPENANEAIPVRENIYLAEQCGVGSIVVISDACRSIPTSLQLGRVRGSLIFPNQPESRNVEVKVDKFYATRPGDPALEMIVDDSVKRHEGVFTHCFLQAYRYPDADMIRQIISDGELLNVVPNRKLENYLKREVPALLQRKKLLVGQLPEASVPSGDDVYIGRAMVGEEVNVTGLFDDGQGVPERRATLPTPRSIIDVGDIAKVAIARAIGLSPNLPESVTNMVEMEAGQSDFDASVRLIENAQRQGATQIESGTGFKIIGARVSEVLGLNMRAELFSNRNDTETIYIRLLPQNMNNVGAGHVSSVVVSFANGSGTVLAGIKDYIGTVLVENGLVMNVSYAPSEYSYHWQEYAGQRSRLEKLRAIVASAARYGVFQVDRENAQKIADQIRTMKGVDPTLGLYAAYAYAEVGLRDDVRSVLHYISDNINAMLFDVAVLAGTPAGSQSIGTYPIVPFCPMLSQGWTLLRVKRAKVPPVVEEASNHLLPALWTTFDTMGMDLILRAIRERRII